MILSMSRTAAPIVLSASEAETLAGWAHSRTMPARLVERAQIIQMAASGVQSQEIARMLEVSRPTVQLWRQRFLGLRLAGLEKDAPRPGRIPRIPNRKIREIVEATLHSKPVNATH
jgi:transposase